MLKGKGKFTNKPTKTKGHTYDKFFIYIPTGIARDSTFPFKDGEEVTIHIESGKVIVEKVQI